MKGLVTRGMMSIALATLILGLAGCPAPTESSWTWERVGGVLEIGYGNSTEGWPQMAALHLNTGALRMVYGPDSGWGPTVYVPPSLWTDGDAGEAHHLGAPVTAGVRRVGADLALDVSGVIAGVSFTSVVRFSPPADNRFKARVSTETSGTATLADRPGEAFKPVHTATMKISDAEWDSQAVRINAQDHPLPLDGWVLDPPGLTGAAFTLVGGSSEWKPNGPSISITLDRDLTLQGWATPSADPNDDNIGFWCASEAVLDSWEYEIVAAP